MAEEIYFTTDAAIIERLGEELVGKQETALSELVKNSFDADATHVEVIFHGRRPYQALEIRDDGTGMHRQELIEGFLRLASSGKIRRPISARYKRRRAGRKGIGRFAAQRLGRTLVLTTRSETGDIGYRLTVDWSSFEVGLDLDRVPVQLEEVADCEVGTTIYIEGLRDSWTQAQMKRCWLALLSLQQPFPVAPVLDHDSADPGFKAEFFAEDSKADDFLLVADIDTEVFKHLHALIEMRVDQSGVAEWRISRSAFGAGTEWARFHDGDKSPEPAPYAELRDVWLKAYYFILQPGLFPGLIYTRLRDILAKDGGIRIYRSNVRIAPYGSRGNDWLQLDEAYSKRSILAPIANRNFFGVIELGSASEGFRELTSREGLMDTLAFRELRGAVSSVLITAATRIASQRGKKTKAGKPAARSKGVDAIGSAVRSMEDVIAASLQANDSSDPKDIALVDQRAREARQKIEEVQRELEQSQRAVANESAMLRLLATLGMVSAEFNHESGMTFDAFRTDFAAVFDAAKGAIDDDALLVRVDRARAMLDRLDSLTAYLRALSSARSARELVAQSLSSVIEDFYRGIQDQARSQEIELELDVPEYDPLFTAPIHRSELASVLLNLYTNSMKAIRRAGGVRRIKIEAFREGPEEVAMRFSDTGDGIGEDVKDHVFDAFYTTNASAAAEDIEESDSTGTGLGLWIIQQIVLAGGGSIEVASPEPTYSTTFLVRIAGEPANNV